MVAEDVAQIAEQLQPLLKPTRGFAPKLSHISAAILIARDGVDSRAVCAGGRNAVPGVPEGAHDRLSKLARRIIELLPELAAGSRPPQPQPRRRAQQPSSASQPAVPMPASTGLGNEPDDEQQLADELSLLGLTPLQPVPDDRDEHVPMHTESASPPSPSALDAYRMPMPPMPPPLAADAAPRTTPAAPPPSRSQLPAAPLPSRSQPLLPDDARADLDADSYLQRESLRDPTLRRLLPRAMRQRRPLPREQAALAASKGHTDARSARRYIKSFGYLHGIGPEPEDLGGEWENIHTRTLDGKRSIWHPEYSSDSDESGIMHTLGPPVSIMHAQLTSACALCRRSRG